MAEQIECKREAKYKESLLPVGAACGRPADWPGSWGRTHITTKVLRHTELRNVNFFTQSKSFKPNFIPRRMHKSRQI